MALWVEMDLVTSCTVFKNQLKKLFNLSDLGYKSYFNVGFCFQFKIPKTGFIRTDHYQSVHKDCKFG